MDLDITLHLSTCHGPNERLYEWASLLSWSLGCRVFFGALQRVPRNFPGWSSHGLGREPLLIHQHRQYRRACRILPTNKLWVLIALNLIPLFQPSSMTLWLGLLKVIKVSSTRLGIYFAIRHLLTIVPPVPFATYRSEPHKFLIKRYDDLRLDTIGREYVQECPVKDGSIPLRIYEPQNSTDDSRHPVYFHIHGELQTLVVD